MYSDPSRLTEVLSLMVFLLRFEKKDLTLTYLLEVRKIICPVIPVSKEGEHIQTTKIRT